MNVAKYKQQLSVLERQIIERLRLESSEELDLPREPGDSGDESKADELHDDVLELEDGNSTTLGEVQLALQRIDAGTFGLCEVDGKPIETARLDAVPWARRCLAHQQELEQASRRTHTL